MIIDTHIHCYDPKRPQGIPWPPKENSVLYRRILPEHYKTLAKPEGVTGTIVVEASTWIEDNQWILDLGEKDPFILGVVGNLDPESKDFASNLNRFSTNPLFRGIRLRKGNLEWISNEQICSNLKRLADKDLSIDLLVDPENLPNIVTLAKGFSNLRIIINHVAKVLINGKAPSPSWIRGIETTSEFSNVYCKISGLVERASHQPAPSNLTYYVPTLDVLWNTFGEDRLIFGSNWPVCEQSSTYATVQNIVTQYFRNKGENAKEKYFWQNSKEAYKWIKRN